jgi:hypothetical protein
VLQNIYTTLAGKGSNITALMYARQLRKAAHTRRFTIHNTGTSGWQVQDEKDSTIVKSVLYDDWHRVERAKAAFAVEVAMLRESGWTETN